MSGDGRITRLVSTARSRFDAAWAAIEARRPHVRSIDATLSAVERDRERAGGVLAGALAYRLFLWLLPFTLVIVAGLGFLASANKQSPSDLANASGVVGIAAESVARAAADSEHARFFALFVGLPTLYLASTGAVKAFRAVSALAWGIRPLPMTRRLPAAASFTGLVVAAFAILLASAAVRHRSPGPGVVATVLAAVAFVWIAFVALWLLPRPTVPWTALLPGALVLGLGAQAIHLTTVYFVSYKVSSSSETYGALGVVAALFLTLYLMGRLFIAGVILNSTLWEQGGQAQPMSDLQSPMPGDARRAGTEEPREGPRAGDMSER